MDSYALLSKRIPAKDRANPLIGGLASLRVKGDKAFALFYGPHRQQYMVPMVREAGSWKANQDPTDPLSDRCSICTLVIDICRRFPLDYAGSPGSEQIGVATLHLEAAGGEA